MPEPLSHRAQRCLRRLVGRPDDRRVGWGRFRASANLTIRTRRGDFPAPIFLPTCLGPVVWFGMIPMDSKRPWIGGPEIPVRFESVGNYLGRPGAPGSFFCPPSFLPKGLAFCPHPRPRLGDRSSADETSAAATIENVDRLPSRVGTRFCAGQDNGGMFVLIRGVDSYPHNIPLREHYFANSGVNSAPASFSSLSSKSETGSPPGRADFFGRLII